MWRVGPTDVKGCCQNRVRPDCTEESREVVGVYVCLECGEKRSTTRHSGGTRSDGSTCRRAVRDASCGDDRQIQDRS
jgi:hypothetical protein